ncbi:hypothetical protein [Lentibacillus sp. CBA3610]|uniref:hypothetical protein n=1 Tax=Lentibacillus sp. CBA3610 TaxID=2518176 RepID=UPI001595D30F|nr:hypothetical protein [Lentibacillus sp. CBA3610]QKY69792.1 hypothetical protein Len3610_09460 [Lentibacillus sp. CBA3610]
MKYRDRLVKQEAKKYRKFLETFDINPGSYRINNHEYFFVNYSKWKQITECAVVSPDSTAYRDEYLEAFDVLLEYALLTSWIFTYGGASSNASTEDFTLLKKFFSNVLDEPGDHLSQDTRNTFNFCLERANIMLSLQERIVEIYSDFEQKYQKFHDGNEENFTKRDVEEAVNYYAEISYLQFRQVTAMNECIPKFKYIKELKSPAVKKHKNIAVRRYLTQYSKEQPKDHEFATYQRDMEKLTKEEHIEAKKEHFYEHLAERNPSIRKNLRHPE